MTWWEETTETDRSVIDDVVDLSFRLSGHCLPVDHAYALSEAVQGVLPWLQAEEDAGIHLIHVAASGHGWVRPEGEGQVLHLSRRTRLRLRLPTRRIDDARGLEDTTLNLDGYRLIVGEITVRTLSATDTLFARHVVTRDQESEEGFVAYVLDELKQLQIDGRRLVCGKTHSIRTPAKDMRTRSVMIADLGVEESAALQRKGLGPGRKMGCGLFIPHKGIGA